MLKVTHRSRRTVGTKTALDVCNTHTHFKTSESERKLIGQNGNDVNKKITTQTANGKKKPSFHLDGASYVMLCS